MADKMKETYAQNVIIAVEENILQDFEVGKQGVVFFIVEEAVNNARKHARAEHIWVNLRAFQKEMALLEIRDDGVGFDVASVNRTYDQRGSLGMVNLRERTELVNGVLNIQSALGKGTQVQVYIPLSDEAARSVASRLREAEGLTRNKCQPLPDYITSCMKGVADRNFPWYLFTVPAVTI